jgi:exopolyphosphatase/guanosine-5'-triphosphate,3'-diphosphate pyrophosphatase
LVELPNLPADQQPVLRSVLRLAQTCEFEVNHTIQVTRLAVRLFEELQALHQLGETQRAWLVYAGILHDIGWIEGWQDHHKVSLRIILTTPMLTFTNKERLIIGSIARYHRKSLPDLSHDHYAALAETERAQVLVLASFLRLADALDHSHQQRVRDVFCKITHKKILISCTLNDLTGETADAVHLKSDLLELAFERKVLFEGLV